MTTILLDFLVAYLIANRIKHGWKQIAVALSFGFLNPIINSLFILITLGVWAIFFSVLEGLNLIPTLFNFADAFDPGKTFLKGVASSPIHVACTILAVRHYRKSNKNRAENPDNENISRPTPSLSRNSVLWKASTCYFLLMSIVVIWAGYSTKENQDISHTKNDISINETEKPEVPVQTLTPEQIREDSRITINQPVPGTNRLRYSNPAINIAFQYPDTWAGHTSTLKPSSLVGLKNKKGSGNCNLNFKQSKEFLSSTDEEIKAFNRDSYTKDFFESIASPGFYEKPLLKRFYNGSMGQRDAGIGQYEAYLFINDKKVPVVQFIASTLQKQGVYLLSCAGEKSDSDHIESVFNLLRNSLIFEPPPQ